MQDAAGGEADLAQGAGELLVAGDDAAEHVAVAAEVLGGAVQHDAGARGGGPLENGGGEGVVGQQRHGAAGVGDGAQVDLGEGGVGGGLDEDQAGVRADGVGDAGRVDPGDLGAEQPGVQQMVAAPVQRADGDDVAQAEGGAGQQDGGEGGHAAGEGDGGLGPLQPGEGGLEAADGGVAEAGVDGRALQLGAGGGEGVEPGGLGAAVVGGVGGGEVERRRVQAEGGEVVAARVDGFRGQGPGCGRRRGGGVRGVGGHGPRVRGRPAAAAKSRATFDG